MKNMINMKLINITIKQVLSGSGQAPAYIEFFDTITKRSHINSIKTFKHNFKLSDDELEQLLKDNK